MKNQSLIAVAVAVVLLFGACILFAGQYFSNGCFWWECAPVRNFNVRDWEIPISVFPSGAFTDPISIPTDNMAGEVEGGLQTVYLDRDGLAVYNIYRFPRVKDAISQFEHDKGNDPWQWYLQVLQRPTQRAPDGWESPRFQAVCVA